MCLHIDFHYAQDIRTHNITSMHLHSSITQRCQCVPRQPGVWHHFVPDLYPRDEKWFFFCEQHFLECFFNLIRTLFITIYSDAGIVKDISSINNLLKFQMSPKLLHNKFKFLKDDIYQEPISQKGFVIRFPDQWQWPLIITEYTMSQCAPLGEGGRWLLCLLMFMKYHSRPWWVNIINKSATYYNIFTEQGTGASL